MRENVKNRCDVVAENRDAISKEFFLENNMVEIIAGTMYAERGRTADPNHIKECRKILRKKQGAFSDLRNLNELILSAKMALQSNPEKYLDDVIEVYSKLRQGKFFGTTYKALAAITICDMDRASDADAVVEKTNRLLKGMKENHRFLTSDEDTGFAVLLAMTDKSVDDMLEELEEIFQQLKAAIKFHDNDVYSLAQVLVIQEGDAATKVEKTLRLYEAFQQAGVKYGKGYELASLGNLISLDMDVEELVKEIAEAAEYLKTKKGFKTLSLSSTTRLMFASMITSNVLSSENTASTQAVVSNAVAMIITEEIAIMIMLCAVTAATTASATSQ